MCLHPPAVYKDWLSRAPLFIAAARQVTLPSANGLLSLILGAYFPIVCIALRARNTPFSWDSTTTTYITNVHHSFEIPSKLGCANGPHSCKALTMGHALASLLVAVLNRLHLGLGSDGEKTGSAPHPVAITTRSSTKSWYRRWLASDEQIVRIYTTASCTLCPSLRIIAAGDAYHLPCKRHRTFHVRRGHPLCTTRRKPKMASASVAFGRVGHGSTASFTTSLARLNSSPGAIKVGDA